MVWIDFTANVAVWCNPWPSVLLLNVSSSSSCYGAVVGCGGRIYILTGFVNRGGLEGRIYGLDCLNRRSFCVESLI